MAAINTIIYLSPGNLPSQMAHTTQIAKMGQALAQQVDRFELVTAGDWIQYTGDDPPFSPLTTAIGPTTDWLASMPICAVLT
jgi:hypothetical protein